MIDEEAEYAYNNIKTNNIDKALRENSNVSYIQLARQKEEVKKIRIKL